MTRQMVVGIIGLGLMGEAYARRLIAAGFNILGSDIDAAKTARLAALGGVTAASVAEIVAAADAIILAVFDTDQVEDVVERAIAPATAGGKRPTVICTSTCDPDRLSALGARVAGTIDFLEVPVSGTSDQVRRGQAVGLVGGDSVAAEAVAPILDAIFARRFHIGRVGDGGRAKLAINLILNLNRVALAEGLVFAERIGLDPEKFLEVARGSAAYMQVMDTKGHKMVKGDFTAEARIRQSYKDVRLMLDQAAKVNQRLPLLEANAEIFAGCVAHGQEDWDNCSVIAEIRRRRTGSG